MTTLYKMPNGQFTESYQQCKDAEAEDAAVHAAFDNRFGALLSTPEGRRAAVDGMRAGALEKSGIVRVVPPASKYIGGLTEAEVTRRVDVADTGVVNRNGAVVFALPTQTTNQASGDILPPGVTRTCFFSGRPLG